MRAKEYLTTILTVFVLNCVAIPGLAQNLATNVPHASSLVKVIACSPSEKGHTSYNSVGFTTSNYNGGTWNDVYGNAYYQPSVTEKTGVLHIDYVNISTKTMHSIEFGLTAGGVLLAEVRDDGTFSHGVEIKHKFGISPYMFPIRLGTPKCVPLRVRFADGTTWINPSHPPTNKALYSSH